MTEGTGPFALPIADLDAVIFDMDGVITDTASVHAASWKIMFDEYLEERARQSGKPFQEFDADADYNRYVDGKPRYDGVQSFLESRGIDLPFGDVSDAPDQETVCGLGNRKNQLFRQRLAEGVVRYDSTVDFIRALHANGIRTAIISSSRNATDVLAAAEVTDLFEIKVDGLDAASAGLTGKPDPAIFLEAARHMGVTAERSAVVEDAQSGVEAGRRGGFGLVIGVDRVGQADLLRACGADVVVEDLSEVTVGGNPVPQPKPRWGHSVGALPSALDEGSAIAARLRGLKPAVFLDYDGTLTPIVEHPDLAVMTDEMRRVVEELADVCPVAIVSGRDLADVRKMVDIEGLVYAGSHGFDIDAPSGLAADNPQAELFGTFLPALDVAADMLASPLAEVPGARLERKRYAIAVHYRQVDEAQVAEVERAVDEVVAAAPKLRKTGGKKIFELRPDFEWDKGKALLFLLAALGLDGPEVAPIYVGDDETDEDAFDVLPERGLGVLVVDAERRSGAAHTAADYVLTSTDEARQLLAMLVALEQGAAQ